MRFFSLAMVTVLLGACGSSGSAGTSGSSGASSSSGGSSGTSGTSGSSGTSGGSSGTSGTSGSSGDGGSGDAGAPGTGTISGGVGGVPFDVAMTVWAGAPDDPTTIVVYVFSKKVDCAKLHPAGWADDGRIPAGTQFLEIKMKGTTAPDTFTVLGGAGTNLAPHEASVNYSITSLDGGVSAETISSGGTATLSRVSAGVDTVGTFSVKFGAATVAGTFDAAFCAGGTEP